MDQIYKIRNDCLNGIEYLNRKRKGLVKWNTRKNLSALA
jgi:hypothetical protein